MSYYDVAYSTRNTVDNTKFYAQQVLDRGVPGALVECGVGAGAQLGAMHAVVGSSRWIYGFDSADGAGVRNNLNSWSGNKSDTVVVVNGTIAKTIPLYRTVFNQHGGIAMLRIDGNEYDTTRAILSVLFPLVSDGGIVIVDDWTKPGSRRACEEYFPFNPVCRLPYQNGSESDGPAYFIKRSVPALAYRKNVFSQNGEDGILAELLRRIESPSKWVCEFGAWDGKECANTFKLVQEGYEAVYIEGRADYFQLLLATCKDYPGITPIHAMVDYDGESILDNILARTAIPTDFDILSIDIDSFDYQVWRSVEVYTPKIVIVEINSAISPLDLTHINSPTKEGTAFAPMIELGRAKGYTLICHTGNLIFVRNDLAHLYPDLVIPDTECYRSYWMF